MTIDDKIDVIASYLDWVEAQPFGAPTHTDAYREHLLMERLRVKEIEKFANES